RHGTTVACYTDGLVERRGESIDDGIERLRAAFFAGPPEAVCSSVMLDLIGSSPAQDATAPPVFPPTSATRPPPPTPPPPPPPPAASRAPRHPPPPPPAAGAPPQRWKWRVWKQGAVLYRDSSLVLDGVRGSEASDGGNGWELRRALVDAARSGLRCHHLQVRVGPGAPRCVAGGHRPERRATVPDRGRGPGVVPAGHVL